MGKESRELLRVALPPLAQLRTHWAGRQNALVTWAGALRHPTKWPFLPRVVLALGR